MTDRYDELRAAAAKATAGTWRAWTPRSRSPEIYTDAPPPNTPNPMIAGQVLRKRDAEYIALANPETIQALLSERESLLAALKSIRAQADNAAYNSHQSGITVDTGPLVRVFEAVASQIDAALTTKEG